MARVAEDIFEIVDEIAAAVVTTRPRLHSRTQILAACSSMLMDVGPYVLAMIFGWPDPSVQWRTTSTTSCMA